MKSEATKQKFIQLRAEGLSYAKISDQLHLSKATCSKWESKFTEEIAELKKDHLQALTLIINETYHRSKMEHTDHDLGLDLLEL